MLLQMHSQERMRDVESLLCAISIIQPDWINEAREEWKNEEEVWALIRKLQQDSSTSESIKTITFFFLICPSILMA